MSLGLMTLLVMASIGVIYILFAFFSANKVEEQKAQIKHVQYNLDDIVTNEGKSLRVDNYDILKGVQKWFVPDKYGLSRINSLFQYNEEINLSNFTIDKLKAPRLYTNTIEWYDVSWVGGTNCFDLSTYQVHHAIRIIYDKNLKEYSFTYIDYLCKYRITVNGFQTKQQLESFIQKSYYTFKQWREIQAKEEQDELKQALNELP